jgi:hypothetical protein
MKRKSSSNNNNAKNKSKTTDEDKMMSIYAEMEQSITKQQYNEHKEKRKTPIKRKRANTSTPPTSTQDDNILIIPTSKFRFQAVRKQKQSSKRRRTSQSTSTSGVDLSVDDDGVFVPQEVIIHFLSYLPMDYLSYEVSLVCVDWRKIVTENYNQLLSNHNTIAIHLGQKRMQQIIDSNISSLLSVLVNSGKVKHLDVSNSSLLTLDLLYRILFPETLFAERHILFAKLCQNLHSFDFTHCPTISSLNLDSMFTDTNSSLSNLALPSLFFGDYSKFPNLRKLTIDNTGRASIKNIESCLNNCKRLEELHLRGVKFVSYFHIHSLSALPNLKIIDMTDSIGISSVDFILLITACNNIEKIILSNCEWVDDKVMNAISLRQHVQSLNISSCSNVTDTSMIQIGKRCKKLTHLNVSTTKAMAHVPITHKTFETLVALQELDIHDNAMLCRGQLGALILMLANCLNLHDTVQVLNCEGYTDTSQNKNSPIQKQKQKQINSWRHILKEYSKITDLSTTEGQYHRLSPTERSEYCKQYRNETKHLTAKDVIWINVLQPTDYFTIRNE